MTMFTYIFKKGELHLAIGDGVASFDKYSSMPHPKHALMKLRSLDLFYPITDRLIQCVLFRNKDAFHLL